MSDNVNHPSHYLAAAVTIEPIELTARMTSCIGQALQYVFRAEYKGNYIEDLEKAVFYLKKQIEVGGYTYVSEDAWPYIVIFSRHSKGLIQKVISALFSRDYAISESGSDEIAYFVEKEGIEAAIEIIQAEIRTHAQLIIPNSDQDEA